VARRLEDHLEATRDALSSMKQRLDRGQEQIASLRKERDELLQLVSVLQAEQRLESDVQQRYQQAESERVRLMDEVEALVAAQEALRNRCKALSEKLGQERQRREAAEAERKYLDEMVDQLNATVKLLKERLGLWEGQESHRG
jgi:predicted  nucleic acid-binding Zn-ribbon protein